MCETVLSVRNVGIKFNLGTEKKCNLKGMLLSSIKRELFYDEFWAIRNISFELKKGDRLGILGLNGAGKSTLLKIIAGVFVPTEGEVVYNGRIAPLLELGAGFEKKYTGRENIYLYGAMLGYSKKYIDQKFDFIVRFSELKRFIDVPLENYSSGMKAKLGFAIATTGTPDILILDEILAVGDVKFKKKSRRRLERLMDRGTTVLYVSHSLENVRSVCNKAIIIEDGKMLAFGDIETISTVYEKMTETQESDAEFTEDEAEST